ncbi:uncharacterized protein LOC117217967 [Megalopta genalis]|uniref:uncharacterized protein LOC117217967 n=1 Tax=Megalopta genalis TaxID=115081 RepID=UPI003FD010B5
MPEHKIRDLIVNYCCPSQGQARHRLCRARIVLVSQNISEEVVTLNSMSMTKGVNFSSCPDSFGKCYCEVNMVDGIMRAARFTEPCISTEGCTRSDVGTFTFEGEYDPSGSADFDQVYENDDRERFDDTLFNSESVRPSQRRLLRVYRSNMEYELRENRSANKKLKKAGGHRRSDDDSDYGNEDDEDEEEGEENNRTSDDTNVGDDEEDDNDEYDDDEEEIGLGGPSTGRRGPGKRARKPRSDHAAFAFEGKREVDEPEREGTAPVEDDCDDDDDTTEPLQYYDYDSGGNRPREVRAKFATPLITLNILLPFIWF